MENTITQKTSRTKKSTRAFLISLVVLVLVSLLNWAIVSNGGDIRIRRVDIMGDDGLKYSALMYIPSSATKENPAPALFMMHGAAGNARNHEAWSVEFARRGFVCLSIDWNGSGESDSSSASRADYDIAHAWLDYLYTCSNVDTERIILSGHSMGSGPAAMLAAEYDAAAALCCTFGSNAAKLASDYHGNLYGVVGDSDVDSIAKTIECYNLNAVAEGFIQEGETVELDHVYGSFEEGNAHVYTFIKGQIHEGVFVNSNTISALLDFSMKAVDTPNPIPADDLIWYWKDFVGLLGMFCFVFTIIFFALVLIEQVPFFAVIKQPMPRNIGLRGVGLVISCVAAILFPIICMKTGTFGLQTALGMQNFPLLSMGRANNSTSLVIGTTLFGAIMLVVFWMTDAKKHNAGLRELGLTSEGQTGLDWKLIGKSFFLAVIVVSVGWTYLSIQTDVLGTDFYCQFFGYKPIAENKFIHYIPYMIIYMICFTVSAIGMNVERRLPSTGKDSLDTAIAIVVNIFFANIAVVAICVIQNQMQLSGGGMMDGQMMKSWAIDITRLWGMPVGMAIGASGSTYCYRKTGNIWLGAFLMGLICALGCVLYGQYTIPV